MSTYPAQSFPVKIYQILENEGENVMRWNHNGTAFRIIDQKRLESDIIPKYFRHNRFSSMQRQFNLYGFINITRGVDKNAFYHPMFRRDNYDEIRKMTRHTAKAQQLAESSMKANLQWTAPSTTLIREHNSHTNQASIASLSHSQNNIDPFENDHIQLSVLPWPSESQYKAFEQKQQIEIYSTFPPSCVNSNSCNYFVENLPQQTNTILMDQNYLHSHSIYHQSHINQVDFSRCGNGILMNNNFPPFENPVRPYYFNNTIYHTRPILCHQHLLDNSVIGISSTYSDSSSMAHINPMDVNDSHNPMEMKVNLIHNVSVDDSLVVEPPSPVKFSPSMEEFMSLLQLPDQD
eukprot:gene10299-13845_t